MGSLAAVTSPPYDVVVRPDGLRHLETADPHNIVRLILPQAATAADRHRRAADTLRRWQEERILAPDPEPALYVYEQQGDGILQRGLIGALRLTPREEKIVLPHEDVMPHIVEDRAALMRDTGANLEPLLFAYRGDGTATGAAAVIERVTGTTPLLSTTTDDGFAHRLWSVTDPDDLTRIGDDLSRRQALIADGHHRWATYLRLRAEQPAPGPWDFGLVLLVDTARYPLRVRAIHRLLHRLPLADALTAVSGAFRVRTLDTPLPAALEALAEASAADEHGNAFLLAGDGRFHLLDRPDPDLLARTVPSGRPRAWRELDATVLHSVLLEHVWRVSDDPEHIGYIHDTAAAVAQAERHGGTAVLMHPVREEVVRELAAQGVTMPRKSTSFGPKPATGLVLRSLTLD
ncbi:SpoOJ or ParA or ParB or repB family protein [Streptomyces mobaraensis NBRC 13819 = DSM 40847]|uniref:SpoOJ or ParA or ParB or repB family protein n=1 Tax=Streptomyces mobaraensis (strain ATCC 29032 / DSM 40847 / JCM 4168 / NBRC 13819 / NCIMB 11159 / IPCR 16-22) TaxID=1223523 RepID=M2ZWZ4_STRM1|nr:SpoOJ or ParA or ParB or repB family protein [Streptomyces mobaraensis NBRC 13819 = DSM 40847]